MIAVPKAFVLKYLIAKFKKTERERERENERVELRAREKQEHLTDR